MGVMLVKAQGDGARHCLISDEESTYFRTDVESGGIYTDFFPSLVNT